MVWIIPLFPQCRSSILYVLTLFDVLYIRSIQIRSKEVRQLGDFTMTFQASSYKLIPAGATEAGAQHLKVSGFKVSVFGMW